MVLVTLASSNITSAEQLQNKRIMFRRHQSGGNIEAMLAKAGLQQDDYEEISHSYDVLSLVRGEVEAMPVYITDQPYLLAQKGLDFNVLAPKDYGVNFYGDLLVTSERYANAYPKRAAAFGNATIKGWQYLLQHPEEISSFIHEKYAPSVSLDKLNFEARQTLKLLRSPDAELGSVNLLRLTDVRNNFASLGYLHTDSGLSDLVLADYMDRPWYRRLTHQQFTAIAAGSSLFGIVLCMLIVFTHRLSSRVDEKTAEIRSANQKLQSTVEKLELANVLSDDASRSKTLFLANMSHEIRTLMNGIYGSLQILRGKVQDEDSNRILHGALESSQHLLQVLNDVLDFSKIEAGKLNIEKSGFDLYDFMSSSIDTYQNLAEQKGLYLRCNFHVQCQQIYTDPVRVRQIIGNLISNAVKFTHVGGVSVRVFAEDSILEISVEDTGIGLDEESCEKVFSRFEQADGSTTRRYGGTGLGLSISSNLARLLGGSLTLESELGFGSTFVLSVPCSEASETEIFTEVESNIDLTQLKILVAEDNLLNQEIVSMMLEDHGIECDVVADGEQAVDAVREQQPDLVLLDFQMPVMDGLQATKLILSEFPDLPVVALTANVMKDDIELYGRSGFTAHVGKPFEEQALLSLISKVAMDASVS